MARIAGVNLEENLKVDFALTKIKGIGWALSEEILEKTDIDNSKRVSDLTSNEVTKLAGEIENYSIEGTLIRQIRGNIQRLKQIGTYRGIRHQRGLPVRGQRTKTNARTKRGKRKTVGAFKKEALTKVQQQKLKKDKGEEK